MKIVLGETDYQVEDLTIEKYELLKDRPNITEVELIHIFTGIPTSEIKQAPFTQINFIASVLQTELINDNVEPLQLEVMLDNVRYGLIRPSQLSYEEWINLEVFMAESPLDLSKLATHLYKPLQNDKGGEDRQLIPYSLDECNSRLEAFKLFPVKQLISALFFLTTFVQELTKISLLSMETKMIESNKRNKNKPKILRQQK